MKLTLLLASSLLFCFNVMANDNVSLWQKEIITQATSLFSPVSKKEFGKEFKTIIVNDNSVSGSAEHTYNELILKINSGLLNSIRLTPDSLRMLICHELGHLFGGAPRKNIPIEWDGPTGIDGRSLLSSEGQSDYYASAVCFKKLIAFDHKKYIPPFSEIGPNLRQKCSSQNDIEMCLRTALAGKSFLNLVYDFDISTEKMDDSISETMLYDIYPDRQCRLDTIISGALCKSKLPLALDEYDHLLNECLHPTAKRPRCWYRP